MKNLQYLCIYLIAILPTFAQSNAPASRPAERHEYYGTLTFDDGQQMSGGPSFGPDRLIYLDALGSREALSLRWKAPDTMGADMGPALRVNWSRDKEGRLESAEVHDDNGLVRVAQFRGGRSEPIEIDNDGVHVRGRLHLSSGDRPHPAVILIHGSGDQDRRFGTFVTFFVECGLAVVAFDKRGVGASLPRSAGAWLELAQRARAEHGEGEAPLMRCCGGACPAPPSLLVGRADEAGVWAGRLDLPQVRFSASLDRSDHRCRGNRSNPGAPLLAECAPDSSSAASAPAAGALVRGLLNGGEGGAGEGLARGGALGAGGRVRGKRVGALARRPSVGARGSGERPAWWG